MTTEKLEERMRSALRERYEDIGFTHSITITIMIDYRLFPAKGLADDIKRSITERFLYRLCNRMKSYSNEEMQYVGMWEHRTKSRLMCPLHCHILAKIPDKMEPWISKNAEKILCKVAGLHRFSMKIQKIDHQSKACDYVAKQIDIENPILVRIRQTP